MPMTADQLEARDATRDIGAELLQSLRDAKAGSFGRVHHVPTTLTIKARLCLGLSRAQLAAGLGVSRRTLLAWERGRREPRGAAKLLLSLATTHPATVREAFGMEAQD